MTSEKRCFVVASLKLRLVRRMFAMSFLDSLEVIRPMISGGMTAMVDGVAAGWQQKVD